MTDSETLNQLRERWGDRFHIWRSTQTRYLSGGEREDSLNGWVATRLRPDAYPDATVMCDTSGQLDAELSRHATPVSNGT
jgi:hypothetical protein